MNRQHSFVACLVLIFISSFSSVSLSANDQWTTIAKEFQGDFSIHLQVKKQANPSLQEWIDLEIRYHGKEAISSLQAHYRLEFRAYEGKNKNPVIENHFNGKIANPHLSPDIFSTRAAISAYSSALLGYPKKGPLKVRALLFLSIQNKNREQSDIEWPEIEFTFTWHPPSKEESALFAEKLHKLLYRPQESAYQHQQMQQLLNNPNVQDLLDLDTLIKATQIRRGQNDGRLAIVQYLNDHFSKEKLLQQHYHRLFFKKDHQALLDLAAAPEIWNDSFLEPLISWFQKGNSGVMLRIMDVMDVHRKNWIDKAGISTIFSDLILYRYENIIHKPHTELSDRELLVWTSAARLLGKTGNPEVEEILFPFLKCKTSIVTKEFQLLPPTMDIPKPLRVADIALEALLQLKNANLEKTYRNAGYRPPYDLGEAEIAITRIRDELIYQLLNDW